MPLFSLLFKQLDVLASITKRKQKARNKSDKHLQDIYTENYNYWEKSLKSYLVENYAMLNLRIADSFVNISIVPK